MRLLDLFCGAGGAAVGYSRAGFDEIVGVDIKPQPRYPFEFIQADITHEDFEFDMDVWSFDAIHASPPCQVYSRIRRGTGHADLVEWTRDWIARQSDGDGNTLPYVIENVPGAPLPSAVQLCGTSFQRTLTDEAGTFEMRRHRWFECSVPFLAPPCAHHYPTLGIYGDIATNMRRNNAVRGRSDTKAGLKQAECLMGIDWMTAPELSQAIPPAYTEYIGRRLLEAL